MRKLIPVAALLGAILPHSATAQGPVPSTTLTPLTVMTLNLYFGADLGPVLAAADIPGLIAATTATFAAVQASDIPARARALAEKIALRKPHLIGLQEAALWRSGLFTEPRMPATTVEFDFVQLLVEALAARGLEYAAVAVTTNFDAQAPRLTPTGLQEIRLTDRDAILARMDTEGDLELSNIQTENFAKNLTLDIATGPFTVLRGWASVDATIGGTMFRFVNAHLEAFASPVQVAQANEIVVGPANTELPVVFVCDCNSSATGVGPDATPTYGNLIAAGFADAWSLKHPGAEGFTCCQAADLRNLPSILNERIDLVLLRSGFGVRKVERVGEVPGDRTPSPFGLWPSDHAGVVAKLELP